MKIAIMQPYFFPYIGYFQLINAVDAFVIYDDVNYIKKGWINRNNILVNNTSCLFSLPLQNASQNKRINEISVSELNRWKNDFLKTIRSCYKKAPFYNTVYPILERILNFEESNLAIYIHYSIKQLCDYLKIDTQLITSSEIIKNNDLRGQDKIIDICMRLHATEYVNAIGGLELYNKDQFDKNKINLHFIKSEKIIYKQFNAEFIPSLSVIDVIMFNSVETTKEFLNKFELV